MGTSIRQPIKAASLFGDADSVEVISTPDIPKEKSVIQNTRDYEYLKDVSPLDNPDALSILNADRQPMSTKIANTATQFGANVVSSFGQGLANTFDLSAQYKSLKGDATDDYNSSLFGLTSREMANWASGVAERNKILSRNPGGFNPSDMSWWLNQIASSGTGIGMGLEALATTALIEYATGGLGTEAAVAKLGSLFSKLSKGARGAEVLAEGIAAAKGMKSAATIYGIMSRVSESRMEAQQTFDEVSKELSSQKNEDGTPKFTEQQVKEMASEGAARDYHYNLALLPLDILSYRTMVFNPISGAGEGLIEKGLAKVAGIYGKSKLGKAAGWLTTKTIGAQFEGAEEGFQQLGQNEGMRYAKVLAGEDDGKGYLERLGETVSSDDFWNSYAGGVIGSPIIGGAMNLVNATIHGKQRANLNRAHKDFVTNIGKMDSADAKVVRDLQEQGKEEEAAIARRMLNSNKTIGALHLDAMTNKETAFDSRITFIQGVLDELGQGKVDALNDLGFLNTSQEQREVIKSEFENYLADANEIKGIYDKVKYQHNKNFVPQITQQHFQLNSLLKEVAPIEQRIQLERSKLPQYNELSASGKIIHDTEYQLESLNEEKDRLTNELRRNSNVEEKQNIGNLLDQINEKIATVTSSLDSINTDENYLPESKKKDNEILQSLSTLKSPEYLQATYDKEHLDNEVSLLRKNLALWNNEKYVTGKMRNIAKNATTQEQIDNLKEAKKSKKSKKKSKEIISTIPETKEEAPDELIKEAEDRINSKEAAEAAKTDALKGQSIADDEEFAHLADILDGVETYTPTAEDLAAAQPTGWSLSPTRYDFNNSPDVAKEKIKRGVQGLLNRIGNTNTTSFEDLVRHVAKLDGEGTADKAFDALRYGWEANGKTPVDYDAVYDKIFGNPLDDIKAGLEQLVLQNPVEVGQEVDKINDGIIAEQEPSTEFDNNNQPVKIVYNKSFKATSESLPKAAFTTIANTTSTETDAQGNLVISKNFTGELAASNNWIDSSVLLDSDIISEGVETTISIPSDFNSIPVAVFNTNGTYNKFISFGQYVAERGLTPDMQEYQDKIPMIHYLNNYDNGGKGVFLVHDVGWYHPIRFDKDKPEEMQKAIDATREIRKEVLNSKTNKVPATITGIRQTTFEGLKLPVGSEMTLREANPQTTFTVVLRDAKDPQNLFISKNTPFASTTKTLLNNKPFSNIGQIVEVRRFGKKDGVPTYVGYPVIREKLSSIAKTSIIQAITIYAGQANRDQTVRQLHNRIQGSIKDTMGIDIYTIQGLQDYLSHFIQVNPIRGLRTSGSDNIPSIIAEAAKAQLKNGTPYIQLEKWRVIFGQAGEEKAFFVHHKLPDNSQGLDALKNQPVTVNGEHYDNILGWYEQNLELNNLALNKPVQVIDEAGNVGTIAKSYNDFLLDNLKTNIRSINIGTKDNPNYVTNIQPVITYDTNKRLTDANKPKTDEEIKEKVIPTGIGEDLLNEVAALSIDMIAFKGKPDKLVGYLQREATGFKEGGIVKEHAWAAAVKLAGGNEELVKRLVRAMPEADRQKVINELGINESVPQELKEALGIVENTQEDVNIAIEEAKKLLGGDLGIGNGEYSLSPALINEDQTEAIAKSIEKIAGLTPSQQYDIVNFMYNQIVPAIEANGGQITVAEVNSIVDKNFDSIVEPKYNALKASLDKLTIISKTSPENEKELAPYIADTKALMEKISNIRSNLDTLRELAYNEVKKYTNIKVTRERLEDDKEEIEEGSDDASYEDIDQKAKEFWTEILSESPENKVSKKMRRFFGQILAYKDGREQQGFLGLTKYTGSDTIIRTLMTSLVNVPSSFDAMIGKMESLKETIPWMQAAIDRLKAADKATKNTFVTAMTNSPLRMRFGLIGYNRQTDQWFAKVQDTNSSGVADSIKAEWINNFETESGLVDTNAEGQVVLNKVKAQQLIDKFRDWKGYNIKPVTNSLESFWKNEISGVNNNTVAIIEPKGNLLKELSDNIKTTKDKMSFRLKGHEYQITSAGNGKYRISFFKDSLGGTKEDIKAKMDEWLRGFGIAISPQTLDTLYTKGLFHNGATRKVGEMFEAGTKDRVGETNGLFGILYNGLVKLVGQETPILSEQGGNPLEDTVINSLANLEARYSTNVTPFGFRDGGKSLFGITAPKSSTDRARDLKDPNGVIISQLRQISFSQPSLWLKLLDTDEATKQEIERLTILINKEQDQTKKDTLALKLSDLQVNTFKDKFNLFHLGLTAIKQQGKRVYGDNSIGNLPGVDHELTKLIMFQDLGQGDVKYGQLGLPYYPDTQVRMRMGTMFSPTMSDKHMMTLLTTAVLDLTTADLVTEKGISDNVVKIIYEQAVKPELQRMIKFNQEIKETNIKNYDKGANTFLMLPEMNNLTYSGVNLAAAIQNQPSTFTLQFVESNEEIKNQIYDTIRKYIDSLTQEKLSGWDSMGGLSKFFDSNYLNGKKFNGTDEEKVKQAAQDFVINSLVANANSFMLFAGDPAMYHDGKSIESTMVNTGKRLANQIAPGTKIANSKGDKYIQLFLKDRVSSSENLDYIARLYGKDSYEYKQYSEIEASDAQEYTTWKEHLDILSRLGKTNDYLLDISQEELDEATKMFSKNTPVSSMTEKQKNILTKVVQPIKPVYTGQIMDKDQDVMRTVYIKSSSFPLIPQLTQGFEIDKLRQTMEKLQAAPIYNQEGKKIGGGMGKNVRASYGTANKVGAVTNPVDIWNEDGTINKEELDGVLDWAEADNSDPIAQFLVLDRDNFKIQQDIPFKTEKNREDRVTLGTQMLKLLFGDEIMKYDGYTYKGKTYKGEELYSEYNTLFHKYVQEKQNQLYSELGLDTQGEPIDREKTLTKLQALLQDEAKKRDYPLQDIEGLNIKKVGNSFEFNMPLWASSNSNRYESMLNSIVTNRMVKVKMPGASYVVGSEEGFIKTKEEQELTREQKSKIIFTSAWNGTNLQATDEVDGKMKKAQVFVASKFRDNDGNLIDLFQKGNDGNYLHIREDKDGFKLNESMFDKDILSMFSFRIPSSGLQSGTQIEVAGILPYESGDLMIIPKNFTKQKGLDFDVDKENAYQFWTFVNKDGKVEKLQEKHRDEYLLRLDKKLNGSSIIDAMFIEKNLGSGIYTDEEIKGEKGLEKAASVFKEKILQNDIIELMHSIYSNTKVQKKINKVLNTKFVEDEAKYIESIIPTSKEYRTILSDEYQKGKLVLGADGKVGTGAYSLDVVFHSLAQQAATTGDPIQLNVLVSDGENLVPKIADWRFGYVKSTGTLGNTATLDDSRHISDLMGERQNMAVDNEKLQVMGRVGINKFTMTVDKVMNMLGFDKGEDGHSISFLFLSQPIIRRYVELMKNANSIVADFDPNKEANIINQLLTEYGVARPDFEKNDLSEQMTNTNFVNNIKAEKPDGALQAAVLKRFLEMRAYGNAITKIQTAINFKSNSLGKSFFDVIEKKNALNGIATAVVKDSVTGETLGSIQNAERLIGEYHPRDNFLVNFESKEEEESYIDIGDYFVKPTTYMGSFNILATMTAYNLWSKYFPYDSSIILNKFNEIIPLIGNGDNISTVKIVELKQEIFKHIKKFLNTTDTGVIQSTDNVNEERSRLFIDSETNTSLAKYLKQLMRTQGNRVVDDFIKSNKLLNRLEFNIKTNGEPSLIKYNNAAGEEYDEQYLYESLASLLTQRDKQGNRIALPDSKIGDKKYTLDTLAQDLVAYSILGNSTQEAIQFTKYIPMSYLEAMGYTNTMREYNINMNTFSMGNPLETKSISSSEKHLVSRFTMQYIQSNPGRVRFKRDASTFMTEVVDADSKELNTLNTFKSLNTNQSPTFISVYDSSIQGDKKFRLFWFDGSKYTRVPVLGTFGMDEYQAKTDIGQTILNRESPIKVKAEPQPEISTPPETSEDRFKISDGNITNTLQSIIDNNLGTLSTLAKELLPYTSVITGGIRYQDSVQSDRGLISNYDATYGHQTNDILVSQSRTAKMTSGELAKTILHETVHGLTINQIKKYIKSDADGVVELKAEAPVYVSNLVRLYNDVRNRVGSDKLQKVLGAIKANKIISTEEFNTIYGITDIYEFMSMSMTQPEFQKYLASIKDNSGTSLLDRFKNIISQILKSIGITFESDTVAAQAINSIFDLIENENQQAKDENTKWEALNKQMWEDGFNEDNNFDYGEDDIEFSMAVAKIPDNIIQLLESGRTRDTNTSSIIAKLEKPFIELSKYTIPFKETRAWKSIADNGYFKLDTAEHIILSLQNSRFIDFIKYYNLTDDIDKFVSRYIATVKRENIVKNIMDMKPALDFIENFTTLRSDLGEVNKYGARDWVDTPKNFPDKKLDIKEENC